MTDQAEKKACGWRVMVRNAIKVVSSNRKATKVKDEAGSLKCSKFFVSDSTSNELISRTSECGDLMMLEAAKTQFGINPVQRTFRGQKILVYTLPSESRNSDYKIPQKNAIAHPIQKVDSDSEPVVKEIEGKVAVKKNEEIKNNGIPDGIAEGNDTGILDGKAMAKNVSANSELKPGGEVEEKQSVKEPSLFSQPVPPRENTPAERMYFGPQPINLQLNVK